MVYILPAVSNLILILLGVVMSLPALADKIEKTPKYRKWLAAICLAAGIIGFVFDVGQRRSSDQANKQLLLDTGAALKKTDDLLEKTNGLVANTSQMVNTFGILMPQISGLNSRIAYLETEIEAAKGNPQLVAELKSQVAEARAQKGTLSKAILLSLASGIVSEMEFWARKWDSDDRDLETQINIELFKLPVGTSPQDAERSIEPLRKRRAGMDREYTGQILPMMINANYLMEQLLNGSELTPEDQKNAIIFYKVRAGEPINWWGMSQVTTYMENLVRRFSLPTLSPPSSPRAK